MPRRAKGLSAKFVEKVTKAGRYADGNGVYLQVKSSGARSWIFRYTDPHGVRREMGLGPAELVSLAEIREQALDLRRRVELDNADPLAERRQAAAAVAVDQMTFDRCTADYLASMRGRWTNVKAESQWGASLAAYAYPVIGKMTVSSIDTAAVLRVIEPIWREKTETASRVRGRIESILDYAKVRGFRSGENPARWKGNLELILPARAAVSPVENHAAVDYTDMPAFWPSLGTQAGIGARALELCILTATRSGEVIGARWEEFDLDSAVWIIPAARMKARQEHRIPLSQPAVDILMRLHRNGEFCFPGQAGDAPISGMTMTAVLRRMAVNATAHGFRSTFRTWASEKTEFQHEVCEAALAHTIGDKVVAAYQRGDLFAKRRLLMDAWAAFVVNGKHGVG
jgi:integrase